MKALVYTGPESLIYRDVPDPTRGRRSRLIRVESVGICGSDMHAYLGHDERRPAPLMLGHEVAGIIATRTDGPGSASPSTRWSPAAPAPACLAGRDNLCPTRQIISMPPRPGGFAESVVDALPATSSTYPTAFPPIRPLWPNPSPAAGTRCRMAAVRVSTARQGPW